jgi:hypothetical protein
MASSGTALSESGKWKRNVRPAGRCIKQKTRKEWKNIFIKNSCLPMVSILSAKLAEKKLAQPGIKRSRKRKVEPNV